MVEDKGGDALTNEESVRTRRKESFGQLINK